MQEDLLQVPEEESTEKPDNHVEAKPLCQHHELERHSLPGQETEALGEHSSRMLESDQIRRRFQARSLLERRKGRRLLVEKGFGGKKAAATKKPAAEKPSENKPPTEEKNPMRFFDQEFNREFDHLL
ncbi:hypothetical protein MDA_GLEAN10013905 [Myotis davidii]|uniref:Uncharacterized protein n=1 Tax=Myotis davidii TaxID=225400 RepID=L5MEW4_MYODS|nr:hypothetical protein MDA_GLEAN10013905 [Myotis davidii]